jgi:peptide deformylase
MIRTIVRDEIFLMQKSEPANMIGINKRIIVVDFGMGILTMVNPVIIKKEKIL